MMTKNLDIITEGQASCLVLSLVPTLENRAKAKQIFKDSPFAVAYLKGTDQNSPVAIGRKVIELNPFKYLSYPSTPPDTLEELTFGHDENLLDNTEFSSDKVVTIPDEGEPMLDNNVSASVSNETLIADIIVESNNDAQAEFDNVEPAADNNWFVFNGDHPVKEEEDENDNKLRYPEEENRDCNVEARRQKSPLPRMNVESVPLDADISLRKECEQEKDIEIILDEMENYTTRTEPVYSIINNLKIKEEDCIITLEESNPFHFDNSYDFDNCVYDDDASVDEPQAEIELTVDSNDIAGVNEQREETESAVSNNNIAGTEQVDSIINNLRVKEEDHITTLEESNLFHFDDSYDFDNCVYDDDASVDEPQEEMEAAVDNNNIVGVDEQQVEMESTVDNNDIAGVEVQQEEMELVVDSDEEYNNEENKIKETVVVEESDEENNIEVAVIAVDSDVEYLGIRETSVESNEGSSIVEEIENPVQVKSKKAKKAKKPNSRILRSALLNLSKKIFSKKTPELPEKYDYIFVSSADMLDYVKNFIDTGDLTSKRFQYWISKSNILNGKVEVLDLGDGESMTGRHLYVLKRKFRKHIVRQQQQQQLP